MGILSTSTCLAEGPIFRHKDPVVNQEFENVYQDLRSVSVSTAVSGGSTTTITVGDNLGSHIATQAVTMNFGFTATTGTFGSGSIYFSTSAITISSNALVLGNVDIYQGGSLDSQLRLRNSSGLWRIGTRSGGGNDFHVSSNTVFGGGQSYININPNGDMAIGSRDPTQALDVNRNTSTTDKPVFLFRNINNTASTSRVALLTVSGDNGANTVTMRAGKSSTDERREQVYGVNSLGLGVGGIDYITIGVSSITVGLTTRFPAGSITSPSIINTDVNSGFYFPSAGTIAFSVLSENAWQITGARQVLQPFQTSFFVSNSTGDANVTGAGTSYLLTYDQEDYDANANFVSSTFTVPVAGKYYFSVGVVVGDTASANSCELRLVTTRRTYVSEKFMTATRDDMSLDVMAYMNASDIATTRLVCSGGADVIDVLGEGETTGGVGFPTYFSGSLIN